VGRRGKIRQRSLNWSLPRTACRSPRRWPTSSSSPPRDMHAGIVLLLANVLRRDEQPELPGRLTVALEAIDDLLHRLHTVALDGRSASRSLRPTRPGPTRRSRPSAHLVGSGSRSSSRSPAPGARRPEGARTGGTTRPGERPGQGNPDSFKSPRRVETALDAAPGCPSGSPAQRRAAGRRRRCEEGQGGVPGQPATPQGGARALVSRTMRRVAPTARAGRSRPGGRPDYGVPGRSADAETVGVRAVKLAARRRHRGGPATP